MENNNLLNDYKSYYQARFMRYEGSEIYKEFYKMEKNLSELVSGCNTMDELMQNSKAKELADNCAVAYLKDIANFEYNWYNNKEEDVRKLPSQKLLQELSYGKTANDTVTLAAEIENENIAKVSNDELFRDTVFAVINKMLEVEIFTDVKVPSKYNHVIEEQRNESLEWIKTELRELKSKMLEYDDAWQFDANKIKEYRHRRLLSFSDEDINHFCNEINKIYQS